MPKAVSGYDTVEQAIIGSFMELVQEKQGYYSNIRGADKRLSVVTGLRHVRLLIAERLQVSVGYVGRVLFREFSNEASLYVNGKQMLRRWAKELLERDPDVARVLWIKELGGRKLYEEAAGQLRDKKSDTADVISEIGTTRHMPLVQDSTEQVRAVQQRVAGALDKEKARLDEMVFVSSLQVASEALQTLATADSRGMSLEESVRYAGEAHTHLSAMLTALGVMTQ